MLYPALFWSTWLAFRYDAVVAPWRDERGRVEESSSWLTMGEEEQAYMWCVVGYDHHDSSCLIVVLLLR